MEYNCLIVDDEIDLAKMTREYFEMSDISCQAVATVAEAKEFLKDNNVQLILLDINLGEESGFSFCKELRKNTDIPVLFVSARQTDDDILMALNIGGDDFIPKPYSLSILLAKVKVVLKRYGQQKGPETLIEEKADSNYSDNAFLDRKTLSVNIRGEKIQLKAKEFDLLECLYERKNTIVTKEELFDLVWKDMFFSDGTLNVHIRRLREKLEENPNKPTLIKTIWGTGYMLEIKDEA